MFRLIPRITILIPAFVILMSFRFQPVSDQAEILLYDVRGAYVASRTSASPAFVADLDRLVNARIDATTRQIVLPRTVLTVRIDSMSKAARIIGFRQDVGVTVEAVAVGSGDVIARGSFKSSVFSFDAGDAEKLLAAKVSARIAEEFRLGKIRQTTLATALFP